MDSASKTVKIFLSKIGLSFRTYTLFGITEKTPENAADKIRLVNGFCALAMVLLAIFSIVDLLRQSYIEVAWDLIAILPFSIPLMMNKKGFTNYSRIAFILICNGTIVSSMWALGSLDVFLNFLPIALALACAVFDWKSEKFRMLLIYLLTILGFYLTSFLPKQGYFINLENQPSVKFFVLGFCSVVMTWLILYFNNNVGQYISATMAQFAAREQELKALAQVGKFAAIGQLAGGIAHEINNPLNIILGKAEMISAHLKKLGIEDEFMTRHLDGIMHTTERISEITHGMLSLTRADSAEKNSYKLKEAINETLSMCCDAMAKHGIKINNQTEDMDQDLMCEGSRGYFQQALMNLLTNARDAILEQASQNDALIEILATPISTGIAIDIIDNGPGISPLNAERIMDPFFTTKEVGKGTGLGLSLSKTLMEAQGGQLILVKPKNPTIFRLILARSKKLGKAR